MSAESRTIAAWVPVMRPPGAFFPVLFLPGGDICYEFYAFLRQPAMRGRSGTWQNTHARAVGLLYDFYAATRGSDCLPRLDHANALVSDFIEALLYGTLQPDGSDPTGLHWNPISPDRTCGLLQAVRRFCAFLEDESSLVKLDPAVTNRVTSLRDDFAKAMRRRHSILAHLKAAQDSTANYTFMPFERLLSQGRGNGRPIPFPKRVEAAFFAKGMLGRRQRNRVRGVCPHVVRDMLFFMLLAYGGLRKSEPLHLYLQDIVSDPDQPGSALVFLYHPESGFVHGEAVRRSEYLRTRYQLVPRNRLALADPLFSGWKSMLLSEETRLTGPRTRVYWRNPQAGRLFWELHRIYIQAIRPKHTKHPYYFVSLSGQDVGRPMTIDSVDDAFRRALARMDLVPDASIGLSPHCLRHLYAQELVDAGLSSAFIQICLHHTSLASQAVYTRPLPSRVAEVLSRAAEKIDRGELNFDAASLGITWKSDPLGIFSTTAPELRSPKLSSLGPSAVAEDLHE